MSVVVTPIDVVDVVSGGETKSSQSNRLEDGPQIPQSYYDCYDGNGNRHGVGGYDGGNGGGGNGGGNRGSVGDGERGSNADDADDGEDGDNVWGANFKNKGIPWKNLNNKQKIKKVVIGCFEVCIIVGCLYLFIASLSFLADGFRLLAGKQAGEVFRNEAVFNNPVAGLMVGILVTVLVQSSSTSTSIIITMVAAELLTVEQAIPLIMGANIGTSVTSTIVALGQLSQRNEFRRAFAGATVHDMFNFMCVIVFLPLEAATGFLTKFSNATINAYPSLTSTEKPPDILKVITNPLTKAVVQLDKKIINKLATETNATEYQKLMDKSLIKRISQEDIDSGKKIGHWFNNTTLTDTEAGVILLISSLALLCLMLYIIVRTLKSLLQGQIAVIIHRSVNGNIKNRKYGKCVCYLEWVSGYLAILVGIAMTIAVQSSSITTSALTPLVGVGVLSLERMYPVVCGANIGTCITGILAALAADGSKLRMTLHVAFAHLLFNLCGITMLYVIWPLRSLPINAAIHLGNTTAKYRWFAILYLFIMFLLLPGIFVGLSLAGLVPLLTVTFIGVAIGIIITIINVMQKHFTNKLPVILQTWKFLPLWMRSLEPYDRIFCKPIDICFKKCLSYKNSLKCCC
tara:strand:+ start:7203 stop:9089 length:1887 start_codon:yes stop_codon:yes gene_type:complete